MDEPIRARLSSEPPSTDAAEAFAGYLDELERLCEAATPGPWTLDEHGDGVVAAGGNPVAETWNGPNRLDDAQFIAAARYALPKLIAKVREVMRDRDIEKAERDRTWLKAKALRERLEAFDAWGKRSGTDYREQFNDWVRSETNIETLRARLIAADEGGDYLHMCLVERQMRVAAEFPPLQLAPLCKLCGAWERSDQHHRTYLADYHAFKPEGEHA